MKTSKLKRLFAVALTVALGMTTLAACGSEEQASSGPKEQNFVYNLGAETKTIDPAKNNAVDGSIVIANAFEGLYKLDDNYKAVPGMAESHELSKDLKTYTFKIRKDVKWSDGKPVTANDFAYAWTRALDPKTAAEYAFQLYYIKNGEKFNTKQCKAEDLGIKVIDDHTLQVELENPTTYFLELTAFPTLMPIRKDIVEKYGDKKWTLKPESYISNGPFKLTEYKVKDSYTFVPNEHYYGAKDIKLKTLTFRMLTDETNSYNAVKKGEIHMSEKLPQAQIQPGQKDGYVKIYPYLGTYFYAINVGNNNDKLKPEVKEFLGNKDVRKALNMSIDRKVIVEKVALGGQQPAHSFVPPKVSQVNGKDFADKQYWDPNKADVEGAKKVLADAGYGEGKKKIPTIELLYNSDEGNKKIAEAIQQMWKEIGVNVNLVNQEWAVFQDSRKNGNFEIARHGWIGDYIDPMTFLDMWMTGLGNNDPKFANSEYDALIKKAMSETNAEERAASLKKAEDILMEELPIIPLYYYTQVKAEHPSAKGVKISPLGQVYFEKAYLE